MIISSLRLVNFRSYANAEISLAPGLNVVVGENATGKTNLLEAAYFALRGTSPRTNREEKLVRWGAGFTRVEAVIHGPAAVGEGQTAEASLGRSARKVEVAYAPGQGKRLRCDGSDISTLDEMRRVAGQPLIFVPESLLLIKGSPARRRAHVDSFASGLERAYRVALAQCQEALRQRNAQLVRVREGASPDTLEPWDHQFASAAVELGRRRRAVMDRLAVHFAPAAAALAPASNSRQPQAFTLRLLSHLDETGLDEEAFRKVLRSRRAAEVRRGASVFGPQRDDVQVLALEPERERDLRLYGSQGEQRAAVLALLLAERAVAQEVGDDLSPLFLDDVMSELDYARRRLLIGALGQEGQAVITTTDLHYFTDAELSQAHIIRLPLDADMRASADVE